MDGFFVAKFIKLSDRKPEDSLEPTGEVEEKAEKVDVEKPIKKELKSSNKKNTKKKRKGTPTEDGEEQSVPLKPKLSVPPVKAHKEKKQKTSANVTKPRRKRAAQDA
jgi:hypothetical protein